MSARRSRGESAPPPFSPWNPGNQATRGRKVPLDDFQDTRCWPTIPFDILKDPTALDIWILCTIATAGVPELLRGDSYIFFTGFGMDASIIKRWQKEWEERREMGSKTMTIWQFYCHCPRMVWLMRKTRTHYSQVRANVVSKAIAYGASYHEGDVKVLYPSSAVPDIPFNTVFGVVELATLTRPGTKVTSITRYNLVDSKKACWLSPIKTLWRSGDPQIGHWGHD